ncbi:MAG: PilN domain-containing protein, partial [Candidatus Omnitrophica bacterium]|nr:PilN domain-containing protein [Candidatus Omnitrophota bacterium]
FIFYGLIVLLVIQIILFLGEIIIYIPYRGLVKQWSLLKPQVNNIESLKREISYFKNQKTQYESILTHKIKFSPLLADIYASLPDNLWLEEISFKNKVVSLSGCVLRWKEDYLVSIDRFIKSMEKALYISQLFKQVELKTSRKIDFFGVEVMNLDIELK